MRARAKQPIINSLATAVQKLRVQDSLPAEKQAGLELIMQDLLTHFGEVEDLDETQARSQKADNYLLSILHCCNRLVTEYNLDYILSTIPRDDLSFPESRKMGLVERFSKLSRYISLGPYLLQLAQRFPVFRNIIVHCAEVPSTVPNSVPNKAAGQMTQGLLQQYLQRPNSSTRRKTIKRFERHLGANLVAVQADIRRKSLGSKRVHAEMQLLFYYEQQPQTQLRPRVICASKNACYLCNAFLTLHNQFYTPKTHGKLYPQWTLPNPSTLPLSANRLRELKDLYRRFHICLEQKIFSCLGTVSLTHTYYDNESRILNIRSLTASGISVAEDPGEGPSPSNPGSLSGPSNPNVMVSTEPLCNNSDDRGLVEGSPIAPDSLTQNNIHEQESHHSACHPPAFQPTTAEPTPVNSEKVETLPDILLTTLPRLLEPNHLVPGHPIRSFISSSSPPTRFHTSRIHAELSYDTVSAMTSVDSLEQRDSNVYATERGVEVHALWLVADDAETIGRAPGVVDLTADWIYSKVDEGLCAPKGLMLRKGRDVLKLSVDALGPVVD